VTRLDRTLLEKIAAKKKTTVQYVREQVSRRAARKGIVSAAELINWARELGISTGRALKSLPPEVQPQARTAAGGSGARRTTGTLDEDGDSKGPAPDPVLAAIPVLLLDAELRSRCADLLRRPKNFDRAVASATTVLEVRIRTRSGVEGLTAVPLVNRALNPDPGRSVLVVGNKKEEQEGFHYLCKGVMLWFRNRTHHHLDAELTRAESLRICAFIDLLLPILDEATVRAGI
jgi:uncharacterized protein (TIGR02391 family)